MTPEIITEIPKDVFKDPEPSVKAEVHNIPVQVINVKKVNPKPDTQIIKKIPSKNAFLATIKKTIEAFIQAIKNFFMLKKMPNHNLPSHSVSPIKLKSKSSILQKSTS